METSRKLAFFAKILLALCAVYIIGLVLGIVMYDKDSNAYEFAYVDKMSALAEHKNDSKTVFVGGSSVAFGLSAEHYNELEGGSKNVINMGLTAGPYDVYLSTVVPYIQKDDVVVLGFELEAYTDNIMTFDNVALEVSRNIPQYYQSLSPYNKISYIFNLTLQNYKNVNAKGTLLLQSMFGRNEETIYHRDRFNNWGDFKEESYKTSTDPVSFDSQQLQFNETSAKQILHYIHQMEAAGAKVYIVYPPNYSTPEKLALHQGFASQIEAFFGDRVAGSIEDWSFDTPEKFLDTAYHLNYKACIERTEYLHALLKGRE